MEEIAKLGERLAEFYERFGRCFRTKTRDTSEYGLKYISGLMRMETDRNLANVGRKTGVSRQNLQHFVSNLCWSDERVILAVENEVKIHPLFRNLSWFWMKAPKKKLANIALEQGANITDIWAKSK